MNLARAFGTGRNAHGLAVNVLLEISKPSNDQIIDLIIADLLLLPLTERTVIAVRFIIRKYRTVMKAPISYSSKYEREINFIIQYLKDEGHTYNTALSVIGPLKLRIRSQGLTPYPDVPPRSSKVYGSTWTSSTNQWSDSVNDFLRGL